MSKFVQRASTQQSTKIQAFTSKQKDEINRICQLLTKELGVKFYKNAVSVSSGGHVVALSMRDRIPFGAEVLGLLKDNGWPKAKMDFDVKLGSTGSSYFGIDLTGQLDAEVDYIFVDTLFWQVYFQAM